MEQEITLKPQEQQHIERLRVILSGEQNRDVTFGEASEIGDALISFFETLADGSDNQISDDIV